MLYKGSLVGRRPPDTTVQDSHVGVSELNSSTDVGVEPAVLVSGWTQVDKYVN